MRLGRTWAIGLCLVSLTLGGLGVVFASVVVPPVSAGGPQGTGTYTCNDATGKISFTPAWSDSGTGKVTGQFTFTATGCSGGSPAPTKVSGSGTIHFANGEQTCEIEAIGKAKTTLTYQPSVEPSVLKGGAAIINSGSGFSPGGRVSGSYPSHAAFGEFLGTPTGGCATGITSATLKQSSQALVNY